MWEIENSLQVESFFAAVLFGGIICLIYDILRAARRVGFNSTVSVFLTDILFSVFCCITTFLFLMVFTSGQIRFYVLAGESLGFLGCRISLSRLWLRFLVWIFGRIKEIFLWLKGVLHRISALFLSKIDCILKKCEKNFKNACYKLKKLLKKV